MNSDVSKTSWLTNALYYKDSSGDAFDNTSTADVPINLGFLKRHDFVMNSKTVDLVMKPHIDVFMQNRPIAANVNIRLKLTRSPASFCLMTLTGKSYKIKILGTSLFVRRIRVADSILVGHKKALENNLTLKYPLRRVETSTYTIPAGTMSHTNPNLVTGQLPIRMIIGIVRNTALNGDYTQSPLRFSPFNMSYLNVAVNGRGVPSTPYTPNFEDNGQGMQYAREYQSLFAAMNREFLDKGNAINREEYADGYTLFAYKLSDDFGEHHFGLVRHGNVKIDIRFGTVTPQTLNVITYLEFENLLELDKNRNVMFNYSA